MTVELRSIVCGDGLYPFTVWFQQMYYRLGCLRRIFAMRQFSHNQPVCTSVYYSHDCSFIVFAYYGVHFQVAESSAACLFRPFPDTCTVGCLYARFSDWSAPMSTSVLVVCGIQLRRFPVVFATTATIAL